jgi:hypothetical protein
MGKQSCNNNFKNMGTKCIQFCKSRKIFCSINQGLICYIQGGGGGGGGGVVSGTLMSEAIRQYLVVRRALGTQKGTYSTEEKSLGSNTNFQTIFNNCHQHIFYLTASFFLRLFGPFPDHNIPFQLGFQNKGVLWSRVF